MKASVSSKNQAARAASTIGDRRWAVVVARDPSADGAFYYAVETTGVYCRPSCPARRARPQNVRFYATCAEAERAGFRSCQRCKPKEASLAARRVALVTRACRLIETSETLPKLQVLAGRVGLSPSHFHRLFKQVAGLTPAQYATAARENRLRQGLRDQASVTEAIYDAGYNSSSRFYEKSGALLGMTPKAFRSGGSEAAIRFAIDRCQLGQVLVAQSSKGICAILLGGNPTALVRELRRCFPKAEIAAGGRAFADVVAAVVAFVDAPGRGLGLPLDVRGTAFQKRVWRELSGISVGETASYTEIARRIGDLKAVRAVAGACAANVLGVAIPCHRAVRVDGGLAGYRWGVARKRALLKKEAQG